MADDISVEEFTDEVRAFLRANAELRRDETTAQPTKWGEGSDDVSLFEEIDREQERADLRVAQAWRAKRYDAGLGWITGPKEFGGRELSQAHERAYGAEEARYRTPPAGFFGIGLGMVAPTIKDH